MTRSLNNPSQGVVSGKGFRRIQFWHEMVIAARFGIVGIVATAVHISVVWLLLKLTGFSPISANTFAFLTAFGISFVGNYRWTFGSPGNPSRAIKRFLLISVSGFSINTLLLAFLVRGEWFSPTVSAIFSAAVVPLVTFFASRFWGFQDKKRIVQCRQIRLGRRRLFFRLATCYALIIVIVGEGHSAVQFSYFIDYFCLVISMTMNYFLDSVRMIFD